MFRQIFTFEIKYRLNRPATWIYWLVFVFAGFITVATGSTPATEKVMHNAPWTMSEVNIVFSFMMMLVCSAVMGVPLYRDIDYGTRNYLYALPISKTGYFWGRFAGSFLFVLLIGTGVSTGALLGAYVGPLFGWVPEERIAPYGLWNYYYPFFAFAIGNLFISSAIFFALVSFTRNIRIIYSASIMLFIAYLLGNFLTRDIENHKLIRLFDPFLLNAFSLETRFLTPYEKNTFPSAISQEYLFNRLIWAGLSLLLLLAAWYNFSFRKFLQPERSKDGKPGKQKEDQAGPATHLPVRQEFGKRYDLRTGWNLTKIEFFNIVRDNYFKAILLGGLVLLVLDIWIGDTLYSVGNLPLTIFIMDYKGWDYNVFIFIILLFYTGEAVHREKATRFDTLNDAFPVSNTVRYLSKLAGLIGVAFVLASIPTVVGVMIQTIKGLTDYRLDIYLIDSYLLAMPGFIQMILLSFAVHLVVNHKFAGHGIALLIWVGLFLLRAFGEMNYNLFFYFFTPDYQWSDMNYLGHFAAPLFWYNLYWTFFGCLLATVAFLFFQRGITGGFREKWRVAKQRFTGMPRVLCLLFLAGWLASGAYIHYQVSYLNEYYSTAEERNIKALYEKALKQYEHLPQPKVTSLSLHADIFPEERKISIKAALVLKNKTSVLVQTLHLRNEEGLDYSIRYNGDSLPYTIPFTHPRSKFSLLKKGEKAFGYRIYQLSIPLQPGDSAAVEVTAVKAYKGFHNHGLTRDVVYNGTFYAGGLPSIGYDRNYELESDEYRKKLGLGKKTDDLPPYDDPAGRNTLLFSPDADLVHFEAILSTTPDQIAIAPGYLRKSWEQDGRKYFHYVQDTPIQLFFNISSARYEVLRDYVVRPEGGDTIRMELYYDKRHPFNLDRFKAAYADGLQYFSEVYGPFQFRQMRLTEFPRYASFAQSFANTVPYSENFGWVADFTSPDDFDYAYFVTAHELAHQWWGHQVTPNATRGSNLISEALAEYTALILTERKYGKDNMKRFLKDELDKYLNGRANESKKENAFINCNRPYQWYNKGSLVLYGLRDLIGDTVLNRALRQFRDEFALRENPPFPGSHDLYAGLQRHTPDSLRYYLTDTWEKITLYENKLEKAVAKQTDNGTYEVTLELSARKLYADSLGKETPAAMNDYIDIGIFGEESRNKAGQRQTNPLFLRKYKLGPGKHKITVRVKGKPVKAGIDPYHKLIDRIPDDNSGEVEL